LTNVCTKSCTQSITSISIGNGFGIDYFRDSTSILHLKTYQGKVKKEDFRLRFLIEAYPSNIDFNYLKAGMIVCFEQ